MKVKLTLCLTIAITTSVFAQDHPAETTRVDYGAGSKQPIPRNVYWGETHLHTTFPPEAALAVGDRHDNDYLPAIEAGLHALLLDRDGTETDASVRSIATLAELEGLIEVIADV